MGFKDCLTGISICLCYYSAFFGFIIHDFKMGSVGLKVFAGLIFRWVLDGACYVSRCRFVCMLCEVGSLDMDVAVA